MVATSPVSFMDFELGAVDSVRASLAAEHDVVPKVHEGYTASWRRSLSFRG